MKFQLHDSLLAFHAFEGAHTGENFMKYVLDILMDFDLCEKLFCITTNNVFNIDTIIKHLFDSILDKTSVLHDMKN